MSRGIFGLALAALASCGGGGGGGGDSHDPWYVRYGNGHPIAAEAEDFYTIDRESEIMTLVNDHRILAGRNALIESGAMGDVARAHSLHMAIHGFEGPVNPEGDDPADRAWHAGISFFSYDEVLSAGIASASDVMDNWLALPPMHDRIDDLRWTHMGAGYADEPGSRFRYYWTVDFADR